MPGKGNMEMEYNINFLSLQNIIQGAKNQTFFLFSLHVLKSSVMNYCCLIGASKENVSN